MKELTLLEEFGTTTFSDVDPEHKSLGRAKYQPDERDWRLEEYLRGAERTSGRQLWLNPLQLNQGEEGACVGFGWTGLSNAEPYPHSFGNAQGFKIYHLAQKVDPWPGEDYSGTSVRAGARVMRTEGLISGFAFSNDVEAIARHVLNRGPCVIGVNWYSGMDRVDENGFIHKSGHIRGGHCVVIDGVTWDFGDVTPNRFRIRNSWGLSWGFNGRARISFDDLDALMREDGEAFTAVEV